MKKIVFVPFSFRCPQHANSASIRLRCTWPAKYLPEATVATDIKDCEDGDVIIFQKVYGEQINLYAKSLKDAGKKIILDLCDPEWLQLGPAGVQCREMIGIADLVTVPTPGMAKALRDDITGPNKVIVELEDCIDIEYHNRVKDDWWKDRPTVLWYGNRGTVLALHYYMRDLEILYGEHQFDLCIISDKETKLPETKIPTRFVEWNLDTFVDAALQCDIVFNPKLPDPIESMKSRNKTYTAWAMGLPCVEVWGWSNREQWMDEMRDFLEDPLRRRENGRTGRTLLENHGTSKHYAERIRDIIRRAFGD